MDLPDSVYASARIAFWKARADSLSDNDSVRAAIDAVKDDIAAVANEGPTATAKMLQVFAEIDRAAAADLEALRDDPA